MSDAITIRWAESPIAPGDSVSYSSLQADRSDYYGAIYPVAIVERASYGDYDNSCQVERSNQRVMLDDEKIAAHVFTIYGSHGYSGLGYLVPPPNDKGYASKQAKAWTPKKWADHAWDLAPVAIREAIGAMEQYPALSDDDLSHLESEVEDQAWSEAYGGRHDFREALGPWLDEQDPAWEHDADRLDDTTVDALWYAGCEAWRGGESCHHEAGGGVYFDVDAWTATKRNSAPWQKEKHTLANLYARQYYEGPEDHAERARTTVIPNVDGEIDTAIEVVIPRLVEALIYAVKGPSVSGLDFDPPARPLQTVEDKTEASETMGAA